jgi:hypothetical protein
MRRPDTLTEKQVTHLNHLINEGYNVRAIQALWHYTPAEIDGVMAYRDSPDGRWLPTRPEYPHEQHGF